MGCMSSNCCKSECETQFHLRQKSINEVDFQGTKEIKAREQNIQMRNYIDQIPDFTKMSQDKSESSPFVTAKVLFFK